MFTRLRVIVCMFMLARVLVFARARVCVRACARVCVCVCVCVCVFGAGVRGVGSVDGIMGR